LPRLLSNFLKRLSKVSRFNRYRRFDDTGLKDYSSGLANLVFIQYKELINGSSEAKLEKLYKMALSLIELRSAIISMWIKEREETKELMIYRDYQRQKEMNWIKKKKIKNKEKLESVMIELGSEIMERKRFDNVQNVHNMIINMK
jgi:hypothetical protein